MSNDLVVFLSLDSSLDSHLNDSFQLDTPGKKVNPVQLLTSPLSSMTPSSPHSSKVLTRPRPVSEDTLFSIHSISVYSFSYLACCCNTQIFALSLTDIDNQLALDRECRVEEISLSTVKAAS